MKYLIWGGLQAHQTPRTEVVQDMRIRRLIPTECERLKGFPDNWTAYGTDKEKTFDISDTQRYKCCGNAVTVNVVQAIMEKIWMM